MNPMSEMSCSLNWVLPLGNNSRLICKLLRSLKNRSWIEIESNGMLFSKNLPLMWCSNRMKYELLLRSENGGDLKNSVPLYGTAQMQVGLSIWFDRHAGGSEEQFLAVA